MPGIAVVLNEQDWAYIMSCLRKEPLGEAINVFMNINNQIIQHQNVSQSEVKEVEPEVTE